MGTGEYLLLFFVENRYCFKLLDVFDTMLVFLFFIFQAQQVVFMSLYYYFIDNLLLDSFV